MGGPRFVLRDLKHGPMPKRHENNRLTLFILLLRVMSLRPHSPHKTLIVPTTWALGY